MQVGDLRVEKSRGVTRFVATVRWDDREREPCEVYYAVLERHGDLAALNPDSFRIPASIVALHDGERRISGAEPMCPILHDGLENNFAWLGRWMKAPAVAPVLDFPVGCAHPRPGPSSENAAFLSGGLDSLALIVNNRRGDPPVQERRLSTAFAVAGIQKQRWNRLDDVAAELERVSEDLGPIGELADLRIVPIATNIRDLHPETEFWKYEFQGAAMAGIAHVFAGSMGNVSIASTWKISHLGMWGSHPLLDPNFGTDTLRIWHELAHLSRLEKLKIISQVPEFLDLLNVCNAATIDDTNCGHCEKCIRTMLELETMGLLEASGAFDSASLKPNDLRAVDTYAITYHLWLEVEYRELIEPLRAVGRDDLADVLTRHIRRGSAIRARKRIAGLPSRWRSRIPGISAP